MKYFCAVPYNFTVEGHLSRFKGGVFKLPNFQRGYVWTKEQALLFVDSVLKGYPLSSLTFAQLERDSVDMYLLDGQQRILSLVFLFNQVFPTEEGRIKVKEWFMTKPEWGSLAELFNDGRYFEKLETDYTKEFRHETLQSIELKPNRSSTFDEYWSHIKECFRRLNLGGTSMSEEEIEMLLSQSMRYL